MAAQNVFGSITPFAFDCEDVTEWIERLEQWFVANSIDDATKKRAMLLSNIGARGYKLLRALSQNNPTAKSFDELKQLLLEHINPKPNEISQRFVFYRRDRRTGESVKDYIAELRKLSEHCNFNDKLEEHLRDKFVCGLSDAVVQQKLLATKNLDLKSALETSITMEAAARSAKQIHGVGLEGQVHRLGGGGKYPSNSRLSRNTGGSSRGQQQQQSPRDCWRCGSFRHLADKCPMKTKYCFECKEMGHAKKKCRKGKSSRVHRVEEEEAPEVLEQSEFLDEEFGDLENEMHFLNLYRIGDDEAEKNDPIMIIVILNKVEVSKELIQGQQ
jgi:hypothetical protein